MILGYQLLIENVNEEPFLKSGLDFMHKITNL